jgi:glutamyl-tRNA synthetase
MKAKTDDELAALIIPVVQQKRISVNPAFIKKVAAMVKERLVFPHEFWEQASFFFEGPTSYDQQMQKKVWKEDTPQIISSVKELLKGTKDFSSVGLEGIIKDYAEKHNLSFGRIAAPLRLLIVGSAMGPHLFDILEMIGREASLERIERGTAKMLC